MHLPLLQPDVCLTDFALSIECLVFVYLLGFRRPAPPMDRISCWFILFFSAASAASLCGGISHGFFTSQSPFHPVIWGTTLFLVGLNSFAVWNLSLSTLGAPVKVRKLVLAVTAVLLLCYGVYVLTGFRPFRTAIFAYLPAAVFWLFTLLYSLLKQRRAGTVYGISGLLVTFVAAGVQQLRIGLLPPLLNYNAFYHLLQGVSFFLLYKCAVRSRNAAENGTAKV